MRTAEKPETNVKNLVIKTEAIQQQNEDKFTAILENQLEIKDLVNSLNIMQATLNGMKNTVNDLSAQSISSQTAVKTIQDGVVSNTVKLMSDSEIAKQNFVMIEKRFDMLAEQKKENSQKVETTKVQVEEEEQDESH